MSKGEFEKLSADPIPPVSEPAKWDKEADIVVVGAGGSGLSAATKIAVSRNSVIVLEKDDDWGGGSQHSTVCEAWGTRAQEREGFQINEEEIINMILSFHNWRPDVRMLRLFAHKGAEFVNWAEDLGFEWEVQMFGLPSCHAPKGVQGRSWLRPQRETIDFLYKVATKNGAEISLGTKAQALVVGANGRITGIKVEKNGAPLFIKGKKAVILATGGFSYNKAMLEKYIPMALEGCGSSYDMPSSTGEGTRMGLGVGADMAGYNSFGVFSGGIPYYREGKGDWHRYLYNGDICLGRQPWLYVNKACERFVNEYAPALGFVTLPIAGMNQPGNEYYAIFDKNYEKYIFGFEGQYCEQPVTPDLPGMAEWDEKRWDCPKDWKVSVSKAIDAGAIRVANTIEELAKKLGLDPAKLEKSVKKYNEFCKKKEDPDYGKPAEFLIPVLEAPFYGIPQRAQLFLTSCGLRVNEKMQVLDKNFDVIPGLYAAYHTAGGEIGDNVVGMGILGGMLMAYTSGMMAAEAALEEGKK